MMNNHNLRQPDDRIESGDIGEKPPDVTADVSQDERFGGVEVEEFRGVAADVAAGDDDDCGWGGSLCEELAEEWTGGPGSGCEVCVVAEEEVGYGWGVR